MLEIGTSGLMSGERKRAAQFLRADTAPFLDSTPPPALGNPPAGPFPNTGAKQTQIELIGNSLR